MNDRELSIYKLFVANIVEMKRSTDSYNSRMIFEQHQNNIRWAACVVDFGSCMNHTVVVFVVVITVIDFFYLALKRAPHREHEPCVVCGVLSSIIIVLLCCYDIKSKNNYLNHHFERRKKREANP